MGIMKKDEILRMYLDAVECKDDQLKTLCEERRKRILAENERDEMSHLKDFARMVSVVVSQCKDKNNVEATALLGECFYRGYGCMPDKRIAVQLWKRSSELAKTKDIFLEGFIFKNGQGVAKDDKKAIELYERASFLGNTDATNNLALCYENGEAYVKVMSDKIINFFVPLLRAERQSKAVENLECDECDFENSTELICTKCVSPYKWNSTISKCDNSSISVLLLGRNPSNSFIAINLGVPSYLFSYLFS